MDFEQGPRVINQEKTTHMSDGQHAAIGAAPKIDSKASPARFHVLDEVCALLLFLYSCENHFRPWDILLWIDQIFIHMLVRPDYTRVLIRLRISKALERA